MSPEELLQPISLLERIRLGQNALVQGLDPTRRHMPYWNCGFKNGQVSGFNHSGAWDHCHDVPRAIHALSMAEEATGESVDSAVFTDLADHFFALFDEADLLPGTKNDHTGNRFVHLHNLREATHALGALARRGDSRASHWVRRMFSTLRNALDETGRIHLDRLPPYVEAYNHHPSQEGRALDALVRYARTTGDELALELADRIAAFALEHDFTPSGALTEEAGTHGHSINALVAGLADLALLTGDAALLERTRAIYDLALPRFNSSFGWSMESLNKFNLRGEANNTGDLFRAALCLGRGGYTEYFGQAERILRSHLLPSQLIHVETFSNNPLAEEDRMRSVADRIRGSFSFPTPNDLLAAPEASIATYDITSGAVDALCEAWNAILVDTPAAVKMNLLFSRDWPDLSFRSELSARGMIEVVNRRGCNLLVRIPHWAARSGVRLLPGSTEQPPTWIGRHVLITGRDVSASARIEFPVLEAVTTESISYQRFTIRWRGDQILSMSPPAKHLPMFPAL
ncbi:MAG: hypothetical protein HYU36_23915 [Planctomycetes bacterium]|nr:hypothetical protein [Planctomycetota bacterium]